MGSKSPFRDRMRAFSAHFPPPPPHADHKIIMAALERRAEMDVAVRIKMGELKELIPPFVLTRMGGSSGFPVAQTLRHFFLEYFDRLIRMGPFSFPSSFNVVESFLSFSERFLAFDLREEREHLLRLHEYMDWYTASSFPERPLTLTDILPEGIVYEYNMVSPLEDFAIETVGSKLRILGVAMVRHGQELSAMIVVGESPPSPSDDEIVEMLGSRQSIREGEGYRPFPGREEIRPDPSYGVKDRYIPELPGHARVIMLARFDLSCSRYDVRYVSLDVGASYMVLTDDRMAFQGEPNPEELVGRLAERLERYSSLFSALASMLYLPAFFVDQGRRVTETKFATGLYAEKTKAVVKQAMKVFGVAKVPFFRTIRCLAALPPDASKVIRTVKPPELEFQSSGFWRPLRPGEIGEAKDGTPIVGKTWVQRTDSWSARSVDSFVVSREQKVIVGKDPGLIYIMRSGSHYDDLYKIGLTRRSSETRAIELSSATGVPTNFEVLAQWEVGDCARVEGEIHKRLKPFRVNKRREFFRGNLQIIISVIYGILKESSEDA